MIRWPIRKQVRFARGFIAVALILFTAGAWFGAMLLHDILREIRSDNEKQAQYLSSAADKIEAREKEIARREKALGIKNR